MTNISKVVPPATPASDCTHDHDESCGYIEAALCAHIHDETCDGLPPTGSGPALDDPGETGTDCVCEILCAENSINEDCPVCAEDFSLWEVSEQEPPVTEDATESDMVDTEPEPSTDEVETEPTTQNGLAYSFEELQSMLDECGTVTLGTSITVPAKETLTLNGMASVNTVIKQYDKVKMKDGKFAVIVEVLEPQKAYIADIELSEGDYTTETIAYADISALMIEVEQPLNRL